MKMKTNLLIAIMFALFAINLKAQEIAMADKVSTAKFIDGDIKEWNYPIGFQEGKKMQTVNAASPWVPQDNKLFWKASWNLSYLFLAIIVQDANVVPYVDGSKGDKMLLSFGSVVSNTGGWGPEATNWGGVIFVPADGSTTTAIEGEMEMQTVIKKSANPLGNGIGGYIVEVKIPWFTFGIDPVIGNQFLFNVEAHDYDQYFEDGVWKDNTGFVNELGWATFDNGWASMANAGRLTLSGVSTGISDLKMAELGFSIFPNPVANVFKVKISSEIQKVNALTITGQKIKEVSIDGMNEALVNVSDVENGIYLMQVETNDGIFSKRFIKQ